MTVLSENDQARIVEFLTRIFNCALKESQNLTIPHPYTENEASVFSDAVTEGLKEIRRNAPVLVEEQIIPQAAAFLLSTGHLVGGVAIIPVSKNNPEAQDPIHEAMEIARSLPHIKGDFDIVAIALTTPLNKKGCIDEVDLDLHHQSIIDMANRTSDILLLVHPETGQFKYSDALCDYDFALKMA